MIIHRTQVGHTMEVAGPEHVTFAYQPARHAFSIWHEKDAILTHLYLVVPTGVDSTRRHELVASAVMPDGYTIFHLVRRPKP